MRIGIDCLYIDPNYSGGINTYTLGLLNGFSQVDTKHEFTIFCTAENQFVFSRYKKLDRFRVVTVPIRRDVTAKMIRVIGLLLNSTKLWIKLTNILMKDANRIVNQGCDILYCPNTVLSSYNYKISTLLSMHDIQQYHFPEYFTKRELLQRKVNYEGSALHATYFQASSQFIKDDLLAHFPNLNSEQITVIHEGVNIKTFPKPLKELPDVQLKYGLPEKYIFFPAQLWKHKNHITVLKALNKISREHSRQFMLVMTGAPYSAYDEIMSFIKSHQMSHVKYLGKVDFEELLALYRNAHFMITAVLYESSSLPILEACASGVPVIASKTPPNEEMSNRLVLNLFEAQDDNVLADLILSLWDDEERRIAQINFNMQNIHAYSWENIAMKYLDFIDGRLNEVSTE